MDPQPAPVAAPVVAPAATPAAPPVEASATAEKVADVVAAPPVESAAEQATVAVVEDASVLSAASSEEVSLLGIGVVVLSGVGMIVRKVRAFLADLHFTQMITNAEMKRLSEMLAKVEGRVADGENLVSRIESLERSAKPKSR